MKGKQGKTMGAIKQYSHRSQINLNDVCRAFGNNWAYWGVPILKLLTKKLIKAREKHPVFARSKDEALRSTGAELGELFQAVEKGEGSRRERSEAADVCVTLIRFLNKEYEPRAGAEALSARKRPPKRTVPDDDDIEIDWFGDDDDEIESGGDDEAGAEAES